MGAVGGLMGLSGGSGGTGFSTNPGVNGGQINTAYNNVQGAMSGQQGLLNALQGQSGIYNQNQVYNQLQGVINGQGPNPAQNMLNQATGANVANQAALMAGQRGSGSNVGLMARQAANQGANLQQQAAGQGATMQSQQALGAMGQAGEMAGNMVANQIGQTNANLTAQQNEQSILQNANNANNAVQGQLANTGLQGQQSFVSGLMNSGGGAMSLMKAHGGTIEKYASGGNVAFGPQSMFGQALTMPTDSSPVYSSSNPGADAIKSSFSKMNFGGKSNDPNAGLKKGQDQFNDMLQSTNDPDIQGASMNRKAAGGGKVPAMVSPGERFLRPAEAKAVAQGKVNPLKVGEQIPGKAKVQGDSYSNDVVPKKLEAGGIVIPRSVMQSKDPVSGAADFVRSVMAKKRVKYA